MATQEEVGAKLKSLNAKYNALFSAYSAAQQISNPPQRAAAAKKVTVDSQTLLTELATLNNEAFQVSQQTGSKVQLGEAQALTASTGRLTTLAVELQRSSAQLPANATNTDASTNPPDRGTVDPRTISTSTGQTGDRARRTELQATATQEDAQNAALNSDWRVRLALAPFSGPILYRAQDSGILAPLYQTDGVLFPYTPNIQMTYNAKYDDIQILQTNYRLFQYTGSGIENISITCDFTAQDTFEANYLLAAIHFFRSVTKMFYGQDSDPKPGTPPPLCYLYGLGEFQFNAHPLAIHSFTYNLPNNVNYIRASNSTIFPGEQRYSARSGNDYRVNSGGSRIAPGAIYAEPSFPNYYPNDRPPTYVPTAINLQIQAYPIISRNMVSNEYSTRDYATGKLLTGVRNAGGGFW